MMSNIRTCIVHNPLHEERKGVQLFTKRLLEKPQAMLKYPFLVLQIVFFYCTLPSVTYVYC